MFKQTSSKFTSNRRSTLRHLVVASAATLLPIARAQSNYPSKPVKVIVPFPPGGTTDIVARNVFDVISKQTGQAFVIDNKAGAAGVIGTSELQRAAPDGYTLGIATTSTHAVIPALNLAVKYDPSVDFTAIGQLVEAPGVLVCPANAPYSSLGELIAYAKKQPGKLSYCSAGVGSIGHLWTEIFKSASGVFMVHIPYRGAAQAQSDLVSGIVQLGFDQIASALTLINSGKLRALAVGSSERLAVLPNTPTFKELGYPAVTASSWFGVVGPAKIPASIVDKLNGLINGLMSNPEFTKKLAAQGLFPKTDTPLAFSNFMRDETNRLRAVAKKANIALDT